MVLTPLNNLLEDGLVDLKVVQYRLANCNHTAHRVYLTLGIGIASSTSPTSSSIFLISTERSATSLSVHHHESISSVA
jgi:hypothetical protein